MTLTFLLFIFSLGSNFDPTTLVYPPAGHSGGYNKVTNFTISMILGSHLAFDNPQGVSIVKLIEHDDLSTDRDDDELAFFAVNSGRGQVIYNIGFNDVNSWGTTGTGTENLWEPMGIAANPEGDVYVADQSNHRVVRLKYKEGKLEYVSSLGDGFGSSPGQMNRPCGVALDKSGNVWVTEIENDRISVFDRNGNFIKVIGVGFLNDPFGIALIDRKDPWNYYRDRDYIVVSDNSNKRLTMFNFAGDRIKSLDGLDLGFENISLNYVAIDYYGMIYVTDTDNSQIHIFSRDLVHITSFGREGSGKKEFTSPRGISVWRRFGQFIILEASSAQYYWAGIDGYIKGAYPSSFYSAMPGSTIAIFITQPAVITLTVYDEKGQVVRNLLPEFKETPGYTQVLWDGKDNSSNVVSPGVYTVKADLEPTYSSRSYFKKALSVEIECTESILDLNGEEQPSDSQF
ncbi:SMP-30/gluconolactonase/LRE family protein [candidate division WOR-3 bacterium]|nr:SMP-30/gluconolactonase/LRE family protein [candidate division WOR-3 bacterium]